MNQTLSLFSESQAQLPNEKLNVEVSTINLNHAFEDFKLIRFQIVKGVHYFVLNDFAEFVVQTNQASRYIKETLDTLKLKGFDVYAKTEKLKFKAKDNKMYALKCVNGSTLLRICQEVHSPRFEPLRTWMADLGYRELQELQNPDLTINRAIKNYEKKGHEYAWIVDRIRGITYRSEYTEAIKESGCENPQYGIYTNNYQKSLIGCNTSEFKKLHGLKSNETIRNKLSSIELSMLEMVEKYGAVKIKQTDHKLHEKHLDTSLKMADKISKLKDLFKD
jgi:hypothetical protein